MFWILCAHAPDAKIIGSRNRHRFVMYRLIRMIDGPLRRSQEIPLSGWILR
jgi:hypothetical protein